jgi:hypothetical protein
MKIRLALLFVPLGFAIVNSAVVHAETLPIASIYPAGNDRMASLNSLAFSTFSGREGQALAFNLEQKVRDSSIQGRPYFTIVPAGSKPLADATIKGDAAARFETRGEIVKQQECAATNAKGKCIERRWVEKSCTRRIITLVYTIAAEGPGRERLFSLSSSAADSALICPDIGGAPSDEMVVEKLVNDVASALRVQFAPYELREDIRVKEGTEGLQGNAKKSFKEGIKLTKKNTNSACEVWAEVNELVSDHPPTLYNLGLCAESRQDFVNANALFKRVADLNRSETYATEGIKRIELRQHAERQMAMQASNRVPKAAPKPVVGKKRKK